MAGPFSSHVAPRRGAQLFVHERDQLLEGLFIALTPSLEKTSYSARR